MEKKSKLIQIIQNEYFIIFSAVVGGEVETKNLLNVSKSKQLFLNINKGENMEKS